MSKVACVACRREIDPAARLCPYCGADPRSGEKADTQAVLDEVFKPRTLTKSESVFEYARQRQGIVVTFGVFSAIALLVGFHAFVTHRNETEVSAAAAVPLAEVTDVSAQNEAQSTPPMPDLQFQYDGHPQTMRTFVLEPGAVAPAQPPVAQAPQAAAQK
jgi:hypothetical protein